MSEGNKSDKVKYVHVDIAGYGLLPQRLPGSCGYLDREGVMAVNGRSCRDKWRGNLCGVNDCVCSDISNLINDRRNYLNPGSVENIVQVLYSGCDRILKSGTQCELCGQWYHNSCGNVKLQVAESGKWNSDRCRSERLRVLEEKLRDAQTQIEELKQGNKGLEEQLLLMQNGKDVGKGVTETVKPVGEKCLVLGDFIIRNVGGVKSNMTV